MLSAPSFTPASHPHLCRLNLGVAQLLEKNLEYLNDCLDDVMVEQVGWREGWC